MVAPQRTSQTIAHPTANILRDRLAQDPVLRRTRAQEETTINYRDHRPLAILTPDQQREQILLISSCFKEYYLAEVTHLADQQLTVARVVPRHNTALLPVYQIVVDSCGNASILTHATASAAAALDVSKIVSGILVGSLALIAGLLLLIV